MIARRLASLLLASAMVHLNVVRADVTCATHREHSAAPAGHTAHHASHQHGAIAAAASTAKDASCETPSQPECCQALASCTVNAVATSEVATAQPTPTYSVALARAIVTPASRLVAPDTPPPRA